jgi:hypothetical protein
MGRKTPRVLYCSMRDRVAQMLLCAAGMKDSGSEWIAGPEQILVTDPLTQEVAIILARAVRTRDSASGRRLFELAVSVHPECAVAWLWLASVTDRDATADARIRTALDLDLGPRPWRDACGELLLAIALQRTARSAEQARAILIEAQYVRPRDARVWVALALTAATHQLRLSYLERALELDGVDADDIRAEILVAAVSDALELVRVGRMSAASDMLLRASAALPGDRRLSAITARIARMGQIHRASASMLSKPAGGRAANWWVRAPLGGGQQTPAGAVLDALADLKTSIADGATLLRHFNSERMQAALLSAAARLTLSFGTGFRRPP